MYLNGFSNLNVDLLEKNHNLISTFLTESLFAKLLRVQVIFSEKEYLADQVVRQVLNSNGKLNRLFQVACHQRFFNLSDRLGDLDLTRAGNSAVEHRVTARYAHDIIEDL